ncbi:MAG: GntR family transcriptional regulator [Shewanella sp.]|nr:GntR family transcriptional regulator [Shewanella sp.]MCF1431135.1 GntR family transcriptional regulator [Shewanella sp.]MCF1440074.1 GntR family transcriptional regulator [Shewanella sp.]MCF1459134.1 GntR family transcriptional regulator [Shewanella sp.]
MLGLLRVNPSRGEPIYRQLQEQVVRLIVGGQIVPGDTLPSVRQIADFLKINPMTVSRAIQNLVEQGYLERRRGQPTRVAQGRGADALQGAQLLEPQVDVLLEQARQLGLEKNELLAIVEARWKEL